MMGVLREELTGIFLRNGRLTPSIVVEEAEPPDSPLHDRFEWDSNEAAHAWRLSQARALIRSVRIRIVETDPKSDTIRAFVHVPDAPAEEPDDEAEDPVNAGYLPVEDVGQSPKLRTIALAQMEREWRLFRRRWQQYDEFWKLVSSPDERAG